MQGGRKMKKNRRFLYLALCVVVMSIFFVGCDGGNSIKTNSANKKINITVTVNALKEFAEAVGGDRVQVDKIIPDGVEIHDFEPKPRDVVAILNSRIFIYNGLGVEAWVDKTLENVDKDKTFALQASKNCNKIKIGNSSGKESEYDPHTWLSLKEAKTQCNSIKEALIKIDSSHKAEYEENYSKFAKQLDELYNEYDKKFSKVDKKSFVTGHAAFAYMCREFGLEQESVEDVFAEGEPNSGKITKLINYCKKYKVSTVFVEEMASPKVSQVLANEINGKVETIYTQENAEDGKNYIQSMRENLEKVYESLR